MRIVSYRKLSKETGAHIARSNEVMADVREAIRDLRETMREDRKAMRDDRATMRDEVVLTREVVRSNEAAFREGSRVMAELVALIRALREDSRAHTRAIMALIDRLENGGAEPAT